MKITAIETLRTEEFANVLWVRVHTDSGIVGLGETFYGAGAVEAHIHDTLAGRLLGRNPLHIEAHPPRDGQPADGPVLDRRRVPGRLGRRHRALGHLRQGLRPARAPDAGRPLPRQAAHLQHLRRLQVCPLDQHQAGLELEPRRGRRPLRGPGRLHDPGRRAGGEPAGERDHGHEDLAVRSRRHREPRPLHHAPSR